MSESPYLIKFKYLETVLPERSRGCRSRPALHQHEQAS